MHPGKKPNKNNRKTQPPNQTNNKRTPNKPTHNVSLYTGKKKINQVFILETMPIKILLHNLILIGRWQRKEKDIRRCVLIKLVAVFLWRCERWQVTPQQTEQYWEKNNTASNH